MESSRRYFWQLALSIGMQAPRIVSDLFRYMAPPLGGHNIMAEGTDECGMHSNWEGGLFSLVYHPRLARHIQLVLLAELLLLE